MKPSTLRLRPHDPTSTPIHFTSDYPVSEIGALVDAFRPPEATHSSHVRSRNPNRS